MEEPPPASTSFLDPLIQLGRRTSGTFKPSILARDSGSRRTAIARQPNIVGGAPLTSTPNAESHPPGKPAIHGFLPLSSTITSPIHTPTLIASAEGSGIYKEDQSLGIDEFTTAPSTPSGLSIRTMTPPTWISTPPTPPPKIIRRSVTCLARPSSPLPPSASFPASTPSHADLETSYFVKRCSSVPAMLPRPRASSDSFVEFKRPRIGQGRSASVLTASPLQATFVASVNSVVDRESSSPPTHSRPIFHIAHDISTDADDVSPRLTESPEPINEEMSADGSWSENESDGAWQLEKTRDDTRKYHALRELLATEVGYLLDLRALVTVYLHVLPTLVSRTPAPASTFSRASSSFTSSPWVNSYSHLHVAALSSSLALSDTTQPTVTTQTREQVKRAPRYLFTDQDVELLSRNAEEILQLHEHFVRELRAEMAPLGFVMEARERMERLENYRGESTENTDAAIRAVSTKFATEASRFSSYQSFCTGHVEALDLVRKIHSQYHLEWDAFEQRCSSLVFESGLCSTFVSELPASKRASSQGQAEQPAMDRHRTTSSSSIDDAVRTLRSRASALSSKELIVAFPSEARKSPPRLSFVDYLIKPVQRICKYPLMLDQLKPGKSVRARLPAHLRSDVDVVVESAAQAMRHVASSVDEARHRQDVAIQSALIISRISLASPAASHMSSLYSACQTLNSTFLSSLGTCLLASSLDVMHHHLLKPSGSSNVSAKYLGAFLYLGGYLILVKVSKGKIYEPKHWFSLVDFDILDIEEDQAMLPCSFRLSSKEHRFELAAACQREKDAWLASIRESFAHSPSWSNEPISSLRFDGKGELIPSALDGEPFEAINALPTIQSIPELANAPDYFELAKPLTVFPTETKQKKVPKHDLLLKQDTQDAPSRRSSTASVKAIFAPIVSDAETIILRRASPAARSRVDHGLQDVISQPCLTARLHASSREEELFQAPKPARAGFVRSHSGLSMAGMAKSRLTRHESVRVLRHKSLIDGSDVGSNKTAPSAVQSLASRRHTKNLSITSMTESDSRPLTRKPDVSSCSPSPFCSPTTAASMLDQESPTRPSALLRRSPSQVKETEISSKRSRSLVDNMKGLFQLHPTSPEPVAAHSNQTSDVETPMNKTLTASLIRRLAKGSLHRRARSAPEVPEEPTSYTSDAEKTDTQFLPGLDLGVPLSLSRSPETLFDPQVAPHPNNKPVRRRSLLSASTFRYSSAEMDLAPHGAAKSISLLQRLKA